MRFQNKTVVITGAGGAIGGAFVPAFAEEGANVVLMVRKASARDEEFTGEEPGRFLQVTADVLEPDSLEEAKSTIIEKFGSIDVLINCAGGNMPGATITPDQTIFDLDMSDFQKVVDLNLNGTVLPSLIFGKVMAGQGNGAILNMSSMAADRVITRVAGYSASKAAMENFTRWLAVELARKFGEGVRVNALAPGFFIGKQNRNLLLNQDGSYSERGHQIIANTPMNRFGDVAELAGAALFLCSQEASFITGVTLPVDGGFSVFSGV